MKVVIIFIIHCFVIHINAGKISHADKLAYLTANVATKEMGFEKFLNFTAAIHRMQGMDVYSVLKEVLADPQLQTSMPSWKCVAAAIGLIAQIDPSNPAKILSLPITRMLDAWGKVPSRLLLGNSLWIGAYDECMEIPEAQYCTTALALKGSPMPFPVIHGSCFPKQCTKEDVNMVVQLLGNVTKGSITPKLIACDRKEVIYSTGAIITIGIMAFILLLCLIGTSVESILGSNKKDTSPEASPPHINGIDNKSSQINGIDNKSSQINGNDNKCSQINGIHNKSLELPDPIAPPKGSVNDTPVIISDVSLRSSSIAPITINARETNKGSITCMNILTSFSLLKNTRAIFSTDVPKGAITCINGIRVISMTWVILGHFYGNVVGARPDNLFNAINILHRFTFLPVANAFVAVDSFFLLSGLLVSYLTLKKIGAGNGKGMGCKNIMMMYVHRYIRLTPSLALVILFYTNVYPLTFTGPFSAMVRQMEGSSKPCHKYWWTNLLYINNFYPESLGEECVGWTWYLANDMQFYLLAPGILLLMLFIQKISNPRKSILNNFVLLALMCFLSMLITGIITGYFDIPTIITAQKFPGNPRAAQADMASDRLYTKPYCRITPYLVGIFLGYLFSKDVTLNVKRGKLISITGWILATVFAVLIVYGPWTVFKGEFFNSTFFNDGENIMYSACYRFVWSCAVAWVIFACHNKYGGIVDSFLSWKVWIPLSRLTYSAYLVHIMVLSYFVITREVPSHYQDSFAISEFISQVILSYASAFILAVCVEYPILNVEKILFKR